MFGKILIANRGEIAVRIARTLDAMGVDSVAVYAEADRDSMHVEAAGEAHPLGAGGVEETYLDTARLLDVIAASGAEAVHPGYGFLSENADFAASLEANGVAFIGPRAEHIRRFGLKHEARALARGAGVSLLPGSGVLERLDEALAAAETIGYPVMLKSSAGGGGIGMRRCVDAGELEERFAAVQRLAQSQFGDSRLFVERCVTRARHVEVQAFGDGDGDVAILGDRDCSLQRRHQKVVEECPAPNLPADVRRRMHTEAEALLRRVRYRSAGTVEFLYDAERGETAFLEVNTRLQVEHGVTELVYGIDLVRWMVELAAGELPALDELADLSPRGCAMEARLCAEDPKHGFRPTPGTVSVVRFPAEARVDTWIRDGAEIPPFYDSLLAKVMTHGPTRGAARSALSDALDATVVHGVETNRDYLAQAIAGSAFVSGSHDTGTLGTVEYRPSTVEVLAPGAQTTVQAYPGRHGYWPVGVPPSGPMDDLSFRLGNRLLGNDEGMPGLEVTVQGPRLQFGTGTTVLVAGTCEVVLNHAGRRTSPAPWDAIAVEAGDVLEVGRVTEGVRACVLFAGGLDVPEVMGSAATFTLAGIGGLNGRALVAGDVLHMAAARPSPGPTVYVTDTAPTARHVLRVTMGPHCTEDFLTPKDIREFLDAEWIVHYHSSRTGVRLVGPRPQWARPDGGDAGLHPSNVHDNAYAFGTIDFTGDMPVVLGPDGPSLGGFACPATVIEADRWKLGQLAAGDPVRLRAVTEDDARRIGRAQDDAIRAGTTSVLGQPPVPSNHRRQSAIVTDIGDIRIRRAAQDSVLVEFGPNVLDLGLRLRVHALETAIADARVDGVLEMTPGIRSLLIRFDWRRASAEDMVARLSPLLNDVLEVPPAEVESRIVHLPLSWDDPACREAVDRYVHSVRADAPWCPDNIEFIRRINGLPDVQAVKDIVFSAEYLVMGLGDVYLGAPVATPVDPRHRLVTTKYNPARTWTAENSVGIGGSYLCVYGMEGPGGYQFVGRTVQVWNHHRRGRNFTEHWLLRPFDRIRFHEVDAAELAEMREAFPRGGLEIAVDAGRFDYAGHLDFLETHQNEIEAFTSSRKQAFALELDDWRARGVLTFEGDTHPGDPGSAPGAAVDGGPPPFVASPLAGSIWSVAVESGQRVEEGDVLFVVESMKAEFEVRAPMDGVIGDVLVRRGETVRAGQPLAEAA